MSDSGQPWILARPAFITLLVPAAMALIGVGDLPYAYYTVLRWVIVLAGVLVIARACISRQYGWIALGVALIVFWGAVTLPATTWKVLDVAAAVLLVVAGSTLRTRGRTKEHSE